MKIVYLPSARSALAIAAVIGLVMALTGSGRATDRSSQPQLQSKLDYCETCHGAAGQGFRGYFPMPRLAGQQPRYIENQLRAFNEHRRTNVLMFNVAHTLTPSMTMALAARFKALDPPPYGDGPTDGAALGKKIFEEGLPQANIPACFACHGLGAKGHEEIPRLAGQLYWYLIKVLTNWSKERGQGAPDISSIMVPTTHNLNRAEVTALAAYLSTLR